MISRGSPSRLYTTRGAPPRCLAWISLISSHGVRSQIGATGIARYNPGVWYRNGMHTRGVRNPYGSTSLSLDHEASFDRRRFLRRLSLSSERQDTRCPSSTCESSRPSRQRPGSTRPALKPELQPRVRGIDQWRRRRLGSHLPIQALVPVHPIATAERANERQPPWVSPPHVRVAPAFPIPQTLHIRENPSHPQTPRKIV